MPGFMPSEATACGPHCSRGGQGVFAGLPPDAEHPKPPAQSWTIDAAQSPASGTAPASLGVQGCMTFTEENQASRPTRDMLLVRNLRPAGGCRSEPAGVSGEWERTCRRTRQSTHSGVKRPQSCRDHGLVSSLCSAVSSSLARHLPMARRIHAWHDLAVSWRLLQHLPCIVVVLLLVQLCAPQRRLGMHGRRDSGPVAGERSGTSALSGHNVVVCAAVCLPLITSQTLCRVSGW